MTSSDTESDPGTSSVLTPVVLADLAPMFVIEHP